MWKVTIKNLLANKVRLILTSFSIVLGVSFISGSYVFTDTIDKTFTGLYQQINQGVDISIRSKTTGNSRSFSDNSKPIPADVLQTVQSTPGVKRAVGGVLGNALIINSAGKAVQAVQGAPNLGSAWVDDPDLAAYKLDSGKTPVANDQVVLDKAAAKKGKFNIGDHVRIQFAETQQEFVMTGIAKFGDQDNAIGSTMALFYLPAAQQYLGYENAFTGISAKVDDKTNAQEVIENINNRLPKNIEAVSGEVDANDSAKQIRKQLSFFNTFLLVFAGVAIFASMFIISNTFSILIAQRTRGLALLRSLGASRRQIIGSLFAEAVVVGTISSIIGVFFGIAIAFGLKALLTAVGGSLPATPLQLHLRTAVVGFVVGLVTTVGSVLIPARRASRIPPVAAMRESNVETTLSARRRVFFSVIGAGLASFLLWRGLFAKGSHLVELGVGAAMAFLTISMFAPLIVKPIATALGTFLKIFFVFFKKRSFTNELGRENTKRNPKRTATTASALMIGVALVSAVGVLIASAKVSVAKSLRENVSAEYVFTNDQFNPFSHQLATTVASTPSVQESYALQIGQWKNNGSDRNLLAMDPDAFLRMVKAEVSPTALTNFRAGGVLVDQTVLKERHYVIGQTIKMEFLKETVDVPIAGTVNAQRLPIQLNYVITRDLFANGYTDGRDFMVLVNGKPGQSKAEATDLEKIAQEYPLAKLRDQKQYVQQQEDQLNKVLGFMSGLLLLSILIAVFGIINTLALSVIERTREIGLLRGVGAQRRQLRQMIRTESIIIAMLGTVLGLVIGVAFGAVVVRSLKDQGITTLQIPISTIVTIVLVSIIVGVLASLFPARRAAKTNILLAIISQ